MPTESAPNLTAAPAETSAPKDDGFAAGFAGEDTSPAARPEPASTPTNGKPAFDPATADWYRTKEEDIPEQWRPYQRQLKSHLAEQTRANQEVSALRQQLNELQQSLQTRGTEDKLAAAVEKLAPREDLYADLRSRLDPEEAGAIDVVREIIKREFPNLAPQADPQAGQAVQELKQQVQALTQYVQQFLQQFQVQQTSADLKAAVDKHGLEALQGIAPTLQGMVRMPNPKTGKAFTVTEAADLLLGGMQEARDTDQQIRTAAKRQAASLNGVPVGKQGPLTNAELTSELQALGFK